MNARDLGALTEELAQLYERGYSLVQEKLSTNCELVRRLPPGRRLADLRLLAEEQFAQVRTIVSTAET